MREVDRFLQEILLDPNFSWVADQITETISQGVSMNAQEASSDSRFFNLVEPADITQRERNRRQKYETSRSYTEDEMVDVIRDALKKYFIDLPSVRMSAIENLKNVVGDVDSIAFSTSDDSLVEQEVIHEFDFESARDDAEICQDAHQRFREEVEK